MQRNAGRPYVARRISISLQLLLSAVQGGVDDGGTGDTHRGGCTIAWHRVERVYAVVLRCCHKTPSPSYVLTRTVVRLEPSFGRLAILLEGAGDLASRL